MPHTPTHYPNIMKAQQQTPAEYSVNSQQFPGTTAEENAIIIQALFILERIMKTDAVKIDSPNAVRSYLSIKMAGLEREVFSVVFLDAQHKVIAYEEMFQGTLNQTSVYPREVVKAALKLNAGAVILAHNHPSGDCTPSRSDELLTQTLKSSLQLVDVRVLDHIIVGHGTALSMAEKGLI